jgi:hypothetical protein
LISVSRSSLDDVADRNDLLNRSFSEQPVGREILITSPAYFSLTTTAEFSLAVAGRAAATVAKAKAEMAMNCMFAVGLVSWWMD